MPDAMVSTYVCPWPVGKTSGACGKRVGWNWVGVGKRARVPGCKYMYFILGEWKGGLV
jgi:hypothetical protein